MRWRVIVGALDEPPFIFETGDLDLRTLQALLAALARLVDRPGARIELMRLH